MLFMILSILGFCPPAAVEHVIAGKALVLGQHHWRPRRRHLTATAVTENMSSQHRHTPRPRALQRAGDRSAPENGSIKGASCYSANVFSEFRFGQIEEIKQLPIWWRNAVWVRRVAAMWKQKNICEKVWLFFCLNHQSFVSSPTYLLMGP